MSTLKIAIQKSGRLNEDSIQILKDCGISINNGNDQLKATASNFPLEVLYLRNSDIPQYLIDGVVDVAIVGDNLLVEKGKSSVVSKGYLYFAISFSLFVEILNMKTAKKK